MLSDMAGFVYLRWVGWRSRLYSVGRGDWISPELSVEAVFRVEVGNFSAFLVIDDFFHTGDRIDVQLGPTRLVGSLLGKAPH